MNRGIDFDSFRDFVDKVADGWANMGNVSHVIVPVRWDDYMTMVHMWARCTVAFTWSVVNYDCSESTKNPIIRILCTPLAFVDIANVLMFSDLLRAEWKKNKSNEYTRVLTPAFTAASIAVQ